MERLSPLIKVASIFTNTLVTLKTCPKTSFHEGGFQPGRGFRPGLQFEIALLVRRIFVFNLPPELRFPTPRVSVVSMLLDKGSQLSG